MIHRVFPLTAVFGADFVVFELRNVVVFVQTSEEKRENSSALNRVAEGKKERGYIVVV